MSETRYIVVLGEQSWTLRAVHLACALARRSEGQVVLLKMVPVKHPIQLGTPAGRLNLTDADRQALRDFGATAQDYGVEFRLQICHYAAYLSGVTDAAEQLAASAVFHQPLTGRVRAWEQLKTGRLKRALARRGCSLYSLEQAERQLTWTPAVTVTTTPPRKIGHKSPAGP